MLAQTAETITKSSTSTFGSNAIPVCMGALSDSVMHSTALLQRSHPTIDDEVGLFLKGDLASDVQDEGFREELLLSLVSGNASRNEE